MEVIKYTGKLQGCQCEQLPEGTLLPDSDYPDYRQHLVYVSEGTSWEAIGYYLCPRTGVLWVSTVLPINARTEQYGIVRTSCRQPRLDTRTLAKGVVWLFVDPVYPPPDPNKPRLDYQLPRGISLPLFPELPLQGLILEWLFSPDRDTSWECGDMRVSGLSGVPIWVYLLSPLSRGESVECWATSWLELITQQVLRSGSVFELWYAGHQIGGVRIEEQHQVSASQFWERFGFDKPYRDTGEEFVEWLKAARRGGRRRG